MAENNSVDDVVLGWPDWAALTIKRWASNSKRFETFIRNNSEKVHKKFETAKEPDDKADVLAELEFASCFLADPRFTLCYEPYESEPGRSPDYFVRAEGLQDFHLEIKRIRETSGTLEIQRFQYAVVEAARAIPSSLGISVSIFSDSPIELGNGLREATPAVIAQCEQAIHECENSLTPDEERVVPIAGFEEEIKIEIVKVPGKDPTLPTANFGGVMPVAYTQKESRKFGDHILDSLGQMRHGAANILAVKIESTPHDQRDLIEALQQLGQQVIAGDEEFFRRRGFAGSKEFYEGLAALSAIVVKSVWNSRADQMTRNLVWRNPRATVSLKEEVVAHLASM